MAKPKRKNYSPIAREAAELLGEMIFAARIQRKMPAKELAERAGVSRGLVTALRKVTWGRQSVLPLRWPLFSAFHCLKLKIFE